MHAILLPTASGKKKKRPHEEEEAETPAERCGETDGRMTMSGQTAALHETWPGRCRARFWRLFPHLTLCCALVAYTMLGALVFMLVEGRRTSSTEQEYLNFLSSIVEMVQDDTSKSESITAFTVYWIK